MLKTYFVSAPVKTAHVAAGKEVGPGYLVDAKDRKHAMTKIRHYRRGTIYAMQDASIKPIHPGHSVTV
jgi:hypothetical protein